MEINTFSPKVGAIVERVVAVVSSPVLHSTLDNPGLDNWGGYVHSEIDLRK
jgi:hypothetical protein